MLLCPSLLKPALLFISIEKYTTLYPQLQKYVPFYRKKSVVVPVEIFQNNSSLYQDVNRRFSI
jgi:hypothetical protein